MNHLKDIDKLFFLAQALYGTARFENAWLRRISKIFAGLLQLLLIVLNLSIFWTFYAPEDSLQRVHAGICAGIAPVMAMFFPFYLKTRKSFENCLKWCDSLHSKFGHLDCFRDCKRISTRLFKQMALLTPAFAVSVTFLQAFVISIVRGHVEQPLMVNFLLLNANNTWNSFIMAFLEVPCVLPMTLGVGLIYAIILTILFHCIALLDAIQTILGQLKLKTFAQTMRTVIEMQCELIKCQTDVAHLGSFPVFLFEFVCYALLLLLWTIVFFIPDMWLLGVSAIGNCIPYVLVCWINERLIASYTALRDTLYDLEWYNMTADQRRTLLLIMISVDHQKYLRAGPFHTICYEELGIMLKRVYSYGLVVNNLVG